MVIFYMKPYNKMMNPLFERTKSFSAVGEQKFFRVINKGYLHCKGYLAIGAVKQCSGMPKPLTNASTCGRSSVHNRSTRWRIALDLLLLI